MVPCPIPQLFCIADDNAMTERPPSPFKILCGRGIGNFNAPGNIRFKEIIHDFIKPYKQASSKAEKTEVIQDVLKAIKEKGGRFVRQSKVDADTWCDISEHEAREKTAHKLRDDISAMEKKAGVQSNPPSSSSSSSSAAAAVAVGIQIDRVSGSPGTKRVLASQVAEGSPKSRKKFGVGTAGASSQSAVTQQRQLAIEKGNPNNMGLGREEVPYFQQQHPQQGGSLEALLPPVPVLPSVSQNSLPAQIQQGHHLYNLWMAPDRFAIQPRGEEFASVQQQQHELPIQQQGNIAVGFVPPQASSLFANTTNPAVAGAPVTCPGWKQQHQHQVHEENQLRLLVAQQQHQLQANPHPTSDLMIASQGLSSFPLQHEALHQRQHQQPDYSDNRFMTIQQPQTAPFGSFAPFVANAFSNPTHLPVNQFVTETNFSPDLNMLAQNQQQWQDTTNEGGDGGSSYAASSFAWPQQDMNQPQFQAAAAARATSVATATCTNPTPKNNSVAPRVVPVGEVPEIFQPPTFRQKTEVTPPDAAIQQNISFREAGGTTGLNRLYPHNDKKAAPDVNRKRDGDRTEQESSLAPRAIGKKTMMVDQRGHEGTGKFPRGSSDVVNTSTSTGGSTAAAGSSSAATGKTVNNKMQQTKFNGHNTLTYQKYMGRLFSKQQEPQPQPRENGDNDDIMDDSEQSSTTPSDHQFNGGFNSDGTILHPLSPLQFSRQDSTINDSSSFVSRFDHTFTNHDATFSVAPTNARQSSSTRVVLLPFTNTAGTQGGEMADNDGVKDTSSSCQGTAFPRPHVEDAAGGPTDVATTTTTTTNATLTTNAITGALMSVNDDHDSSARSPPVAGTTNATVAARKTNDDKSGPEKLERQVNDPMMMMSFSSPSQSEPSSPSSLLRRHEHDDASRPMTVGPTIRARETTTMGMPSTSLPFVDGGGVLGGSVGNDDTGGGRRDDYQVLQGGGDDMAAGGILEPSRVFAPDNSRNG